MGNVGQEAELLYRDDQRLGRVKLSGSWVLIRDPGCGIVSSARHLGGNSPSWHAIIFLRRSCLWRGIRRWNDQSKRNDLSIHLRAVSSQDYPRNKQMKGRRHHSIRILALPKPSPTFSTGKT